MSRRGSNIPTYPGKSVKYVSLQEILRGFQMYDGLADGPAQLVEAEARYNTPEVQGDWVLRSAVNNLIVKIKQHMSSAERQCPSEGERVDGAAFLHHIKEAIKLADGPNLAPRFAKDTSKLKGLREPAT